MKTLKSLLMLCAGLSFCACGSDNEPQFPEGSGAVTVKIVPPTTTRTDDIAFTNGNTVVNGDIKLVLTHNGSVEPTREKYIYYNSSDHNYYLTKTVEGESVAFSDVLTVTDNSMKVTFYNIGVPTSLTASMNSGIKDYSTVNIATGSPNLQVSPEQIPVYGEVTESTDFVKSGSVIPDSNDDNNKYVEFTTTVELKIPVARLEIQVGVGNSFTGFSSVTLVGAYLDGIKPTGNGAVTDYYLQYDNSSTKKSSEGLESPYAILCDNYMSSDATPGTGSIALFGTDASDVEELPSAETCFSYNFYANEEDASTVPKPKYKLCIKVEAEQGEEPIPAIQYAIVNEFVDNNGDEVSFEVGKIYQITNLTLNGNNIQVDESGTELTYALTATVKQAQWTVVTNVNGSWAQGN